MPLCKGNTRSLNPKLSNLAACCVRLNSAILMKKEIRIWSKLDNLCFLYFSEIRSQSDQILGNILSDGLLCYILTYILTCTYVHVVSCIFSNACLLITKFVITSAVLELFSVKSYLPKDYATGRNVEKKLAAEHKKWDKKESLEMQKLYIDFCRSLSTYGVTFFLVKVNLIKCLIKISPISISPVYIELDMRR